MAKPTKHGDKWRIRWIDEKGKRQSAVFDDYKRAQTELGRQQVEAEEIKRGVRNAAPPEKTFGDLCDYWIENRAPRKRSQKDDESIIRKHLRPAFGAMKLRDFGVEEVDAYINLKIDDEELSDKTVSNHVTLLATMLRAAAGFRVPWILHVPRLRKPRVALFGIDYQWLRSDDEVLHDVWMDDHDRHADIACVAPKLAGSIDRRRNSATGVLHGHGGGGSCLRSGARCTAH